MKHGFYGVLTATYRSAPAKQEDFNSSNFPEDKLP